jgi:hypothetical protein
VRSSFSTTCSCAWLRIAERGLIASAGDMKVIDVSRLCLKQVSKEFQEHLKRFPSLQHINISDNPDLGIAGVSAILSSLPGA